MARKLTQEELDRRNAIPSTGGTNAQGIPVNQVNRQVANDLSRQAYLDRAPKMATSSNTGRGPQYIGRKTSFNGQLLTDEQVAQVKPYQSAHDMSRIDFGSKGVGKLERPTPPTGPIYRGDFNTKPVTPTLQRTTNSPYSGSGDMRDLPPPPLMMADPIKYPQTQGRTAPIAPNQVTIPTYSQGHNAFPEGYTGTKPPATYPPVTVPNYGQGHNAFPEGYRGSPPQPNIPTEIAVQPDDTLVNAIGGAAGAAAGADATGAPMSDWEKKKIKDRAEAARKASKYQDPNKNTKAPPEAAPQQPKDTQKGSGDAANPRNADNTAKQGGTEPILDKDGKPSKPPGWVKKGGKILWKGAKKLPYVGAALTTVAGAYEAVADNNLNEEDQASLINRYGGLAPNVPNSSAGFWGGTADALTGVASGLVNAVDVGDLIFDEGEKGLNRQDYDPVNEQLKEGRGYIPDDVINVPGILRRTGSIVRNAFASTNRSHLGFGPSDRAEAFKKGADTAIARLTPPNALASQKRAITYDVERRATKMYEAISNGTFKPENLDDIDKGIYADFVGVGKQGEQPALENNYGAEDNPYGGNDEWKPSDGPPQTQEDIMTANFQGDLTDEEASYLNDLHFPPSTRSGSSNQQVYNPSLSSGGANASSSLVLMNGDPNVEQQWDEDNIPASPVHQHITNPSENTVSHMGNQGYADHTGGNTPNPALERTPEQVGTNTGQFYRKVDEQGNVEFATSPSPGFEPVTLPPNAQPGKIAAQDNIDQFPGNNFVNSVRSDLRRRVNRSVSQRQQAIQAQRSLFREAAANVDAMNIGGLTENGRATLIRDFAKIQQQGAPAYAPEDIDTAKDLIDVDRNRIFDDQNAIESERNASYDARTMADYLASGNANQSEVNDQVERELEDITTGMIPGLVDPETGKDMQDSESIRSSVRSFIRTTSGNSIYNMRSPQQRAQLMQDSGAAWKIAELMRKGGTSPNYDIFKMQQGDDSPLDGLIREIRAKNPAIGIDTRTQDIYDLWSQGRKFFSRKGNEKAIIQIGRDKYTWKEFGDMLQGAMGQSFNNLNSADNE